MKDKTIMNLDRGLKTCHVLSECRGVVQGIALGDFKSTAITFGLLTLYILPVGYSRSGEIKLSLKLVSKSNCMYHLPAASTLIE